MPSQPFEPQLSGFLQLSTHFLSEPSCLVQSNDGSTPAKGVPVAGGAPSPPLAGAELATASPSSGGRAQVLSLPVAHQMSVHVAPSRHNPPDHWQYPLFSQAPVVALQLLSSHAAAETSLLLSLHSRPAFTAITKYCASEVRSMLTVASVFDSLEMS